MRDEVAGPDTPQHPAAHPREGGPVVPAWPSRPHEVVSADLEKARARHGRELIWFLVGVTPATLLPAAAAFWNGAHALGMAFVAAGCSIQTIRWLRSAGKVRALEKELARTEDEGPQAPPDDAS